MANTLNDAIYSYLTELVTAFSESETPVFLYEREKWRRQPDGRVIRQKSGWPSLGFFAHTFKESSARYNSAVDLINQDPDFGPILGMMIGTNLRWSRFDVDTVINHVVEGIVDEQGQVQLNPNIVNSRVADLRIYVNATERPCTVVIPLRGLGGSFVPFELDQGIEIDELTNDEIEACAMTGTLQPVVPGAPILDSTECVGVRVQIQVPTLRKTVEDLDSEEHRQAEIAERLAESTKPHVFGRRSVFHFQEILEDVIFVLRLCRDEFLGTPGAILISSSHMGTNISRTIRNTQPFNTGNYLLDDATVAKATRLWQLLKSQAGTRRSLPLICERRFNAAIDRVSIEDAVIDHLIAAEALFLKDGGEPEDRGELGFRLALRAASFLEDDQYDRKQIYAFVKRAYGLRSTIAHGGSLPTNVTIAGRDSMPVHQFVEELSCVMRRALSKAIESYANSENFGSRQYWEDLLFSSR